MELELQKVHTRLSEWNYSSSESKNVNMGKHTYWHGAIVLLTRQIYIRLI